MLPDATVLVTSRPHASEIIVTECKGYVFQHIKVAGFTEENVQAFISSSVGDDSKLLEGLQTYVSSYPHIESMMYNPLNAAIVVEVYSDSYKDDTTIPKTMTELYSSLIRSLLLRYMKEHPVLSKQRRTIRQFTDFPSDMYQQFCEVCSLAYEGITNHQQVIFTDLADDFDSLDLMQCVPELYVDEGAVLSYNFLHLTIQEFLAAYHVSLQSAREKVEFFRKHQKAQSNQMVLKFFAGLTNLDGISDDELLPQPSDDELLPHTSDDELLLQPSGRSQYTQCHIKLMTIHFLFEAKQRIKMLNALSQIICDVLDDFMSPFEYYALGYIVSLTICLWKISIDFCNESTVAMLAKGTLDSKHDDIYPAEALPVSLTIKSFSTVELSDFFKAHPSFLRRIISLELQEIGTPGHICEVFSKQNCMSLVPQLVVLSLSGNFIGSDVDFLPNSCPQPLSSRGDPPAIAFKIIHTLKTQNTLKFLNFRSTFMGEPECEALAQWLSSPTCSLRILNIGGNGLIYKATQVLITSLCQNCTLNELDISCSSISLELLPSLIQLPLLRLNLDSCRLGPEEMRTIGIALCSNSKLEILELENNPIRDEGAIALAKMLMQNKTLKHISLHNYKLKDNIKKECWLFKKLFVCGITKQGAQALQKSLKHNDTLLQLILPSTSMEITDKRIRYDVYLTLPNEYSDYFYAWPNARSSPE